MGLGFSLNKLTTKLILLAPFIGFFNLELINGVGILEIYLDLLFFLIILFYKISLKKKEVLVILVLLFVNVLGSIFWHITHPLTPINIVTIGFLYKNWKFIELLIIAKFLKKQSVTSVDSWITFLLSLFIIWTVFYSFFLQGIISSFTSPRVSFPFTDFEKSNAHLYSFCFGFVLACFALFTNQKNQWKFFFILLSLIALQFTGSRNYIVALGVPIIFLFWRAFIKQVTRLIFPLILVFTAVILIFDIQLDQYLDENNIRYLLDRVYSLDLDKDSSAQGRIIKLLSGLEYFGRGLIIIGLPIGITPIIWFDGIFPSILIQFGLIGLIIIVFILYIEYRSIKSNSLKFLLVYMIIGNLITEFIYVTRGLIFSVFIYLIIKQNITIIHARKSSDFNHYSNLQQ